MSQTQQDLKAQVNVRPIINSSPSYISSSMIFLVGHTLATTTPAKALYTPIGIGQITSISSGVAACKLLGLSYVFLDAYTLDLTKTDELAAMIINVGMQYQLYSPNDVIMQINAPNVVVGILGTSAQNTKTLNPFGTTPNDLITQINNMNTYFDTFVSPYEYVTGDNEVSGNYLSLISSMINSRWNSGKPIFGRNWAIFADTSITAATQSDNVGLIYSSSFAYPCSSTSMTTATFLSNIATIITGLKVPYNNIAFQAIPNIPSNGALNISDDQATTLLSNGWSPILTNTTTMTPYFNSVISSNLVDDVTGLSRSNMIDYTDFCKFHYFLNMTYVKTMDSNIYNKSSKINLKTLSTPAAATLKEIIMESAQYCYNQGMSSLSVTDYSNKITVSIDPENIRKLKVYCPFFPSNIFSNIDITAGATDVSTMFDTFALNM